MSTPSGNYGLQYILFELTPGIRQAERYLYNCPFIGKVKVDGLRRVSTKFSLAQILA